MQPRPRRPTLDVIIAFRAEQVVANRLDALAETLSTRLHEANRSDIARAAIERGLDALEAEAQGGSA